MRHVLAAALLVICGAAHAQAPYRGQWDTLPLFPVDQLCSASGQPATYVHICIADEQGAYDVLQSEWNNIPADTRKWCLWYQGANAYRGYERVAHCIDGWMYRRYLLQGQNTFHP